MPFWVKRKDHKFPRAFFEQNTVLNFENTFLSVFAPENARSILAKTAIPSLILQNKARLS